MKFMKLGSKPDLFVADGDGIRYVACELASDVTVNVREVKFFLHKFPLLSKSIHLRNLVTKACGEDAADEIYLPDFPGGAKTFELCAKFCYGMAIVVNAYNIVAIRCAAEYLAMNEDVERGNLVFKIEVFLNSCIFRGWRDSIIALKTTKYLLPWSEELKIISQCVDSIASKISVDPADVCWSYTPRKRSTGSEVIIVDQEREATVHPVDWWVEDISGLDVDLYREVMVSVKVKGSISIDLIMESLRAYAVKWLPSSVERLLSEEYINWNRSLVETIIQLIPSEKGSVCSPSFLLKLLKVAILIEAEKSMQEELLVRVSQQLGRALVDDLLIQARPPTTTVYDVDLVQALVDKFMADKDNPERDFMMGEVGGLIDAYLAVVAIDPNLSLSSFICMAAAIPNSERPLHDGLYSAINIYLKEHPNLTKEEKKRLCGLIDAKKLSVEAAEHAVQNELLPLRMVVQVLFFEQMRAARPAINEENWEDGALEKTQKEMETNADGKNGKSRVSGGFFQPSRSRRILEILGLGKGKGDYSRGSETSGSCRSPTESANPRETKSSGSSSRQGRHSVS